MRLIDADKLTEVVNKLGNDAFYMPCVFKEIIEKQPTILDIDDHIKKLDGIRTQMLQIEELVRSGGKE